MRIDLPDDVQYIISRLEENSYEAYAVGGCVRDCLMGREPKDWDVCTTALPEQMMEVFKDQRIIETGLKHGTITLLINSNHYELTTYRTDGKYSDNRRPDNVKFVNVLKRDLARRDFTINAMAYNQKAGLVDYYNGQQDLSDKRIKCVGNPNKRFKEDALRIMRALRFAGEMGFSIEQGTAQAMYDNKELLNNISVERIAVELNKLICATDIVPLLNEHKSILTWIIPEMIPMIGFEQNTPYHCYDVFMHTLHSVDSAVHDVKIRLTMLLHDTGKPHRYTEEDGVGHFYGHPAVSADIANEVLKRLRYDKNTVDTVTELILYHDADIHPSHKRIKRWLNRIGEERFKQLLQVRRADALAQTPGLAEKKLLLVESVSAELDIVLEQQQCFLLKDLAVSGKDLIDQGIKEGKQIGALLNRLMDMVINEEVENDREALLEKVQEWDRALTPVPKVTKCYNVD